MCNKNEGTRDSVKCVGVGVGEQEKCMTKVATHQYHHTQSAPFSMYSIYLDKWEVSDNLPSREALTSDRYSETMQGGDLCQGRLVLGWRIDQTRLADAPSHTN